MNILSNRVKLKTQMTNEKKYDLEERTADFGENIIDLAKTLPRNPISYELAKFSVLLGA